MKTMIDSSNHSGSHFDAKPKESEVPPSPTLHLRYNPETKILEQFLDDKWIPFPTLEAKK